MTHIVATRPAPRTRRRLAAALTSAGAVVAGAAALTATAPAADAAPDQLPVPYTFLSGAVTEITHPGAPPAGANDWSCRPTPAHPRPVVLVHGTFGGAADNWATYGPLLHNQGYCVYTLTYGALTGTAWPLAAVGGLGPIDRSVEQVASFVDRVLDATGAGQVDLLGHSQGTLVSGAVAKLARPGRVGTVVSLAPLWQGSGGDLPGRLIDATPGARGSAAGTPAPSIDGMLPGSDFLGRLWSGGTPYAAGVRYTNISTRYDEAVVPYTSGQVPGPDVTGYVVQDGCEADWAEHAALASDPRAADHVLRALDPTRPEGARCVPVAPVHGAVGAVPPA